MYWYSDTVQYVQYVMYVCMYLYVHVQYVCMYVCMYACMYVPVQNLKLLQDEYLYTVL